MSQFSRRKFMFASGVTAAASVLTNACSKKVEGETKNPTAETTPAVSVAAGDAPEVAIAKLGCRSPQTNFLASYSR
jgi:TAT (twin-arginine translocation) pathway signal sequence